MPIEPDDGHAACAETIRQATGRHAGQRGDERTDRQDEPDKGRVEPERAGEIERPDHQRRHHHGRDERAHGEARAQRGIAEHRQSDQWRRGSRLDVHEQAGSEDRCQQESHVERTEDAPDRHGERIGRERQRQQQRAQMVEAGPIGRRSRGDRAGKVRYARSKARMPSGTLTRKIARQPRPAIRTPPSDGPSAVPIADIVPSSPMALPVLSFGDRLADKRHGERHHDGGAEALRGPRGDQQPERWARRRTGSRPA